MATAQKRTRLTNVFISYKRDGDDQDLAVRLESDLHDRGVKVWRDKRSIALGSHWDESVKKGIRQCAQFLIVLSPESVQSDHVMNELHFAIANKKWVIPILHEHCEKPLIIERHHHADFSGRYEDGLAELLGLSPPPATWLYGLWKRARKGAGLALILALVIALGIAGYWFLWPSKTSCTVTQVELRARADPNDERGPIPLIVVELENSGGRASTIHDDFSLSFPPEIPVKPQPLDLSGENPSSVPGHHTVRIRLTADGLEAGQLENGTLLDSTEAVARLPGRFVTLHYRIQESSRSEETRQQPFRAELLKEFIWRRMRAREPESTS